MIPYIFLGWGAKRRTNLGNHPAARQQVANLSAALDLHGIKARAMCFEHARKVDGLSSLPVLKTLLERAKATGGVVLMDDLRRLFAKVPGGRRAQLLNELLSYSAQIADLRMPGLLSKKEKAYHAVLLTALPQVRFELSRTSRRASAAERRMQTEAASEASQLARATMADEFSRKLSSLHDEMLASGDRVTLAALVERANEAGLATSRGGPWSISSAHRALQRQRLA